MRSRLSLRSKLQRTKRTESSVRKAASLSPEPFQRSRTECQLASCFLVRSPAELGGVVHTVRSGVPQGLFFGDSRRLSGACEFCKGGKPHRLGERLIVNHVIHARLRAERGTCRARRIVHMHPVPDTLTVAD